MVDKSSEKEGQNGSAESKMLQQLIQTVPARSCDAIRCAVPMRSRQPTQPMA
jgi:hypothetical protein